MLESRVLDGHSWLDPVVVFLFKGACREYFEHDRECEHGESTDINLWVLSYC